MKTNKIAKFGIVLASAVLLGATVLPATTVIVRAEDGQEQVAEQPAQQSFEAYADAHDNTKIGKEDFLIGTYTQTVYVTEENGDAIIYAPAIDGYYVLGSEWGYVSPVVPHFSFTYNPVGVPAPDPTPVDPGTGGQTDPTPTPDPTPVDPGTDNGSQETPAPAEDPVKTEDPKTGEQPVKDLIKAEEPKAETPAKTEEPAKVEAPAGNKAEVKAPAAKTEAKAEVKTETKAPIQAAVAVTAKPEAKVASNATTTAQDLPQTGDEQTGLLASLMGVGLLVSLALAWRERRQ